ncbi:hypothetical protein D187_007700 [Cystobacter fuscus DSM 2262]|uniref:Uncharacterized protein n=1 Tax=Cystobacter fuscus (strain ATCC 25194 / DSM 2262 / NBRC 100088 / M29) TaxID=1242864 RepID=S9QIQ8_CYSF2|nr:hypothetical protein D187_007700 [Cystobacter fuscus DSM 2262]
MHGRKLPSFASERPSVGSISASSGIRAVGPPRGTCAGRGVGRITLVPSRPPAQGRRAGLRGHRGSSRVGGEGQGRAAAARRGSGCGGAGREGKRR